MQDYHQILTEVQRHLAQQYLKDQGILNQPGVSAACKIDPFHYLVLEPSFFLSLAKWSGYRPLLIQETLLRTGNLLRLADREDFSVDLSVTWDPDMHPLRIKAGFVLADFIDSGLRIYAQQKDVLPVSELKILSQERQRLQELFQGKTQLGELAFA
ncbi:MAG: hypothetical protein R6U22_12835 [Desulfohalobiaceae bacterium]